MTRYIASPLFRTYKHWEGKMTREISRRGFLAAMGITGATAAVGLAGCAAKNAARDSSSESAFSQTATIEYDATETMDVDVVVVGSGSSGCCAAVQAAELGASVLILEKNSFTGGNGGGTEGIFALGSSAQIEQNIEIPTFREIIATDAEFFNYRIDSLFWKNMVENSADNYEWLNKNGVLFSGLVDTYYGLGKSNTFHWFKDGSGYNFVDVMNERAQELGATLLISTPAVDIIMDGDAVVGLYAEKEDSSILQINAKAIVLATGGYADSVEMMAERGYFIEGAEHQGFAGHDGDGLRMAVKAGGNDVSRSRCFAQQPYTFGIDFFGSMTQAIHRGGPFLWVNENGERYCNENCGAITPGNNSNAVHSQKESWLVFDTGIVDMLSETVDNLVVDINDAVDLSPKGNVQKADTIDELAGLVNLDTEALTKTLDRYNELCIKGIDEDFNKDPSKMIAMTKAPYYAFRQQIGWWTSIGGIDVDRDMQVITLEGNPIPGLYAVGTDSCQLYRETYTMNIPSSCQGNSVNSARLAAKAAVASFS